MRCYNIKDIDYHALIKELSLTPNHPYSLHIRNHLLAPYAANPLPPSVKVQDAWTIYQSYRRNAQVVAFGDVPTHVFSSAARTEDALNQYEGLWGVAIVFPSYAPGWVKLDADTEMGSDIWHGLRVSMWLSSEHTIEIPASSDEKRRTSVSEEALIDYVFHDFVPSAARRLKVEAEESTASKKAIVDLFAVNDAWVKILRAWTEAGDGKVKLTRANPCMMFIKSEEDAISSIEAPADAVMHFSTIQEADMPMVQQSNSLIFPIWYINHRRHISIMLRGPPDTTGDREAVAWAYAHDDLSVASLHVIPSHRRQGLGRICVQAMVKKLIQAQKNAMIKAGVDTTLATPAFLDTEMHKGASRLFFESLDFTGVAVLTWGSITVSFE